MLPFILLPRFFKLIGMAMFAGGYAWAYSAQPNFENISDGTGLAVQCLILFGLLFIACSRQKTEDEMIRHMRLTSLQYAVIVFVLLRLLCKLIGYITKDESWMPMYQANFLILLYIVIFYLQAVVKPWLTELFSKGGGDEK